MNRPLTDLDFITASKYVQHIPDLFSSLGFNGNARVNTLYGRTRQIYEDPKTGRHVDIFVDKLSFCHEIELARRLTLDPVTISLADLFLEKAQIVKISEKDVKDIAILLREHELGNQDNGSINTEYIVKLLSDDWGFYYTATTNLKKVRDYVETLDIFGGEDKRTVQAKIDALTERIERQGKSMRWKLRARTGTKMKWYNEAEDVENFTPLQ
jgi:hypothetical protein